MGTNQSIMKKCISSNINLPFRQEKLIKDIKNSPTHLGLELDGQDELTMRSTLMLAVYYNAFDLAKQIDLENDFEDEYIYTDFVEHDILYYALTANSRLYYFKSCFTNGHEILRLSQKRIHDEILGEKQKKFIADVIGRHDTCSITHDWTYYHKLVEVCVYNNEEKYALLFLKKMLNEYVKTSTYTNTFEKIKFQTIDSHTILMIAVTYKMHEFINELIANNNIIDLEINKKNKFDLTTFEVSLLNMPTTVRNYWDRRGEDSSDANKLDAPIFKYGSEFITYTLKSMIITDKVPNKSIIDKILALPDFDADTNNLNLHFKKLSEDEEMIDTIINIMRQTPKYNYKQFVRHIIKTNDVAYIVDIKKHCTNSQYYSEYEELFDAYKKYKCCDTDKNL
jgi:hypothetical protein